MVQLRENVYQYGDNVTELHPEFGIFRPVSRGFRRFNSLDWSEGEDQLCPDDLGVFLFTSNWWDTTEEVEPKSPMEVIREMATQHPH